MTDASRLRRIAARPTVHGSLQRRTDSASWETPPRRGDPQRHRHGDD
ncbi:hypothetical protein [Capillimicrobium parvum]|nr:hypothetical protein [Capillimicrobium parvum]